MKRLTSFSFAVNCLSRLSKSAIVFRSFSSSWVYSETCRCDFTPLKTHILLSQCSLPKRTSYVENEIQGCEWLTIGF